jgi:YD repeat-containing protein
VGRRIADTMPGGQSEGFTYDLAGNLLYETNFNGNTITNQYDSLKRLIKRYNDDYSIYDNYTYTPTGQRQSMSDEPDTYDVYRVTYQYDNRDRLTQKVVTWHYGNYYYANGQTASLNYRYDANGNLTNLWSGFANGVNLAYGYDAAGRKIAETNTYGQVTWFDYWPSGSLKAMTNATGSNYWLYSDAAGACSACGNSGSVTDCWGRVTESVASPHGLPLQTIRRAYAGATGADAATNTTTYLSGLKRKR